MNIATKACRRLQGDGFRVPEGSGEPASRCSASPRCRCPSRCFRRSARSAVCDRSLLSPVQRDRELRRKRILQSGPRAWPAAGRIHRSLLRQRKSPEGTPFPGWPRVSICSRERERRFASPDLWTSGLPTTPGRLRRCLVCCILQRTGTSRGDRSRQARQAQLLHHF
jgi:hypothetical protein